MFPLFKNIYATLLEYTSLSHNIGLPPIFHSYMRQSQNLPLPPRIHPSLLEYTPFSAFIWDTHRIYPSLPEYTLFYTKWRSQNLPFPPSLPPSQNVPSPSFKHLYATLPEFTPLSQIISPFFTTMWDTFRRYPSLPKYTPSFPLGADSAICNNPRIYAFLTEYTPFYVKWRSQNLPLPPRIYPLFCNYMRHSQNLPLPPRIYPL